MIIHLGVTDIPYVETLPPPKGKARKTQRALSGTQTTGDVAGWLEDRYHVMENFIQLHGEEIAAALEDGLAGAIETMLIGGPTPPDLIASGADKIEEAFRRMIDSKELDALGYPGIPTRASVIGIRRRFKSRRDPGRPSFQDTGLYEASFKVWADT